MDRIDCLRAFISTMECGSFSAAAHELGVGQPAVSKRIAQLEQEFGSQLFLRTTRKLKPTPEARLIYDQARQMLELFETTRASVREPAPRPAGTLRISVPSSFGRHFMLPIVAEYVRDYPEVRVDMRFTERMVNLVDEGIELALRIGELESSSMVARRIATVRRYLAASPTYLHGRRLPRTPEDLNEHQCIGYARFASANQWTFESEHGRHVVDVAGPLVVDDADAMRQAVLEHLGIAVLPVWNVVSAAAEGRMEVLLSDYRLQSLPLHAVYVDTHWMSIRARRFLDLLVARAAVFEQEVATFAQ